MPGLSPDGVGLGGLEKPLRVVLSGCELMHAIMCYHIIQVLYVTHIMTYKALIFSVGHCSQPMVQRGV